MTPEAQRIAFAESQGWKFSEPNEIGFRCWHTPAGNVWGGMLPDTNDLNVIQTAVNALTIAKRARFVTELDHVTQRKFGPAETSPVPWLPSRIVEASSAEWLEALLITVGKWKDE